MKKSYSCRVIVDSIKLIPALKFLPSDPSVFQALSRPTIKTLAWEQQYAHWQRTRSQHTLPPQYTSDPVSVKELPPYMHYDTPMSSARRSRLRFDRALLNASRVRLGFKEQESPECDQCSMKQDETVSHVIAVCPLYAETRRALLSSLSKLRLSIDAQAYIKDEEEGITRVVVTPERIPKVSKSNLRKIHRRTAKYINELYDTRPKHF